MTNPFDLKTALLARHAQHVVLIHFPIALFLMGAVFDVLSLRYKKAGLAEAAYYNLMGAAISALPAVATGLLAWRFQLEGQTLKGILLLHLVFACVSTLLIWLAFRLQRRDRRRTEARPALRLSVEFLAVVAVTLTGHLGGFLSGVNVPG